MSRPSLLPFIQDTAIKDVRMAEDGWNSKSPEKAAPAYRPNSIWRNRADFISGRVAIVKFLTAKRTRELDCRLTKEIRAFEGNRPDGPRPEDHQGLSELGL
ncbi:DUF1348 family protein [Roseovarius sp. CAU 1744]|uniref:DUF1348 family protein n=1 Tax=Roseovarius sp. CAU 1744 TaxID=3140368 RepID=UPI00325BE7F8